MKSSKFAKLCFDWYLKTLTLYRYRNGADCFKIVDCLVLCCDHGIWLGLQF